MFKLTNFFKYRAAQKYLLLFFALSALLFSCKEEDSDNNDPKKNFIVINQTGDTIRENGNDIHFDIQLGIPPNDDIVVQLFSSDETEGVADASSLTFNPDNWNVWQNVRVSAVADNILDGPRKFFIGYFLKNKRGIPLNIQGIAVFITNEDDGANGKSLENVNFSLIRAGGSCPAGFEPGLITIDSEDSGNSDALSGEMGDIKAEWPGITLPVCSSQSPGPANLEAMKNHDFIVLRSGDFCPPGYSQGTLKVDTEDDHNADHQSGNTGDSRVNGNHAFLYLCKSNNDPDLEKLKNSRFAVLKNGACPHGFQVGYLKLDTEDDDNADSKSGDIGSSFLSEENTASIYLGFCGSMK